MTERQAMDLFKPFSLTPYEWDGAVRRLMVMSALEAKNFLASLSRGGEVAMDRCENPACAVPAEAPNAESFYARGGTPEWERPTPAWLRRLYERKWQAGLPDLDPKGEAMYDGPLTEQDLWAVTQLVRRYGIDAVREAVEAHVEYSPASVEPTRPLHPEETAACGSCGGRGYVPGDPEGGPSSRRCKDCFGDGERR